MNTGGIGDVEVFNGLGAQTVLWPHFQDHAVLIALGVDGGDQTLAKRVIECIVNGSDCEPQAPRGFTVDLHIGLQSLVLVVTHHHAQLSAGAQALQELLGPNAQGRQIGP